MDPAKIATDLITSAGPAGAGVVLIFFVAGKARDAYNQANKEENKGAKLWFLAAWLSCWFLGLGLIGYSAVFFVQRDPQRVVQGTLSYLKGSQSLWAMGENDPVYIGIHDPTGLVNKTISWAIIGPRMSEGRRIPFRITGTKQEPDYVFEMEVLPDFYDGELVYLTVDFPRKVTLSHGKTTKEFTVKRPDSPTSLASTPGSTPASWWSQPIVHAQSKAMEAKDILNLLEVDDPSVRRNAQDYLVKSGKGALPAIDAIAKDPHRSYRAWLGALSVLNRISALDRNGAIENTDLSPAMLQAMVESLSTPGTDVAITSQIKGYMIAHRTEQIEAALRSEFKTRIAKGPRPEDVYELADTFFGVLYNLGIAEKDRYRGPDQVSQGHFKLAVARFDEAWQLRKWASPFHVSEFPKALYGWALTLQDRATLDGRSGAPNDVWIAAARTKYMEFLSEVERTKQELLKQGIPAAVAAYPAKYGDNIQAAQKFISAHP